MKKLLITLIFMSVSLLVVAEKNIMLVKLQEGSNQLARAFNQEMEESGIFSGKPLDKPKFQSLIGSDKISILIQASRRNNIHYILEPILDVKTYPSLNVLEIRVHEIGENSLKEIQPKYFKHVSKKGPKSILNISKWLGEIRGEISYLLRTSGFKPYAAYFTAIEGDELISDFQKKKFRTDIGKKVNNNQTLLSREVFIEYLNDGNDFVEYKIIIINSLKVNCEDRECHSVIANISMEGGQARDCDSPLNIYQRSDDDIAQYLAELEKIYSELNTPQ